MLVYAVKSIHSLRARLHLRRFRGSPARQVRRWSLLLPVLVSSLLALALPLAQRAGAAPLSIEAQQAFRGGNVNAAIALWSQMITAGQEVQDSLYNRAQAFLVLRQFQLALNDLNQLEMMQRPSVRSYTFLLRGIVFNEMQSYEAALRDFDLAEKIDKNRLVFANRAVAYQRTGQFVKAEQDLLQAIRSDPSQANLHNLAAIQLSLAKYGDCAANAGRVLAINRTFYPAYTVRGICFYHLGRLEEALADFLRSTTLSPAQADASHYLGLSLIALGKPESAQPILLRAADLYLNQNDQAGYQQVMQILSSRSSSVPPGAGGLRSARTTPAPPPAPKR